jgi:hypothetical protein
LVSAVQALVRLSDAPLGTYGCHKYRWLILDRSLDSDSVRDSVLLRRQPLNKMFPDLSSQANRYFGQRAGKQRNTFCESIIPISVNKSIERRFLSVASFNSAVVCGCKSRLFYYVDAQVSAEYIVNPHVDEKGLTI